MDHYLIAALLGVVEGLTEFIPVSSTGHLILFVDLLGFKGPHGRVFEIVIQLGAILAVCWLYRMKLWQVARGAVIFDAEAWRFARNVKLAFIPAALIGVAFHDTIKSVLFSPQVVSVALVLGGIAILLIEKYKPAPRVFSSDAMHWKTAIAIGCFQALAMIPGVSRSGATIMGALLCGLDRRAAAEFSFFLAIPTMLAATSFDLYENWKFLDSHDAGVIAVGFIAAFLSGRLVVSRVLDFVGKHGFAPFAYYRIVLGTIMLAIMFA